MKFSENNDDNGIVESHKKKIKEIGYKKYIFSIDERCSELLDSMSIEERNDLVNSIICEYNDTSLDRKQIKNFGKGIIKTLIIVFILMFAAPLCLYLVNLSFDLTKNSYGDMQKNFEILYENSARNR